MESNLTTFKKPETYYYAAGVGALSYAAYSVFGDNLFNVFGAFAATGLSSALLLVPLKHQYELKDNLYLAAYIAAIITATTGSAGALTYLGVKQIAPNFGPGNTFFVSGMVGSLVSSFLLVN